MANRLNLPSSPVIRCQDRFDLLDSDSDEVPFWDLLTAILTSESDPIRDITSLIEALETICISLRGTSRNENYDVLREFMTSFLKDKGHHEWFFGKTWPFLVNLALETPKLFPDGTLPCFSPARNDAGIAKITLSRRQIACLVVHQFLCSLPSQPWQTESFVDLRPWFSRSNTSHPGAVNAYLTALFTYFENLSQHIEGCASRIELSTDEWPITFEIRSIENLEVDQLLESNGSKAHVSATSIEICHLVEPHTGPALLGVPHGACVISANKCFGYGPTGTQEELHVGISPESYPAVLLATPLSDNQVLICRGAEPMVSIRGYGRDAKLDQILPSSECDPRNLYQWKYRTMLFMDALEMDILGPESDFSIPDVHPPIRLAREMVLKAYNAFRNDDEPYEFIVTGFWGCRTFGGNKYVKCLLQWCAASLAKVPVLKFVLAGSEQIKFAADFNQITSKMRQHGVTVSQVFEALAAMKDCGYEVNPDRVFEYMADRLGIGWQEMA